MRRLDEEPIVESVQARAALAGNPSDGYAGAVFAIPLDAYAATVTLHEAEHWSVCDQLSGRRVFESIAAVHDSAAGIGPDDPHALLLATVTKFLRSVDAPPSPCSIVVTSTIPVSVGLAGSSAIVIGVLRALYRAAHQPLPHRIALASAAFVIETQQLGITAGLQDRLLQAFGRPLLMRFDQPGEFGAERAPGEDRGSSQMVEPAADLRFLVAHRAALSEPSHVVHGDLRRRFDAGDQAVRGAMSQLKAHAVSAANAFAAGDAEWLGESMDATYELRASMIDLVPGHVEMIDAARSAGASANYTGSGGAIVVLSPNDEVDSATRQSLNRLGCEVVAVDAGPGAPWPTWSPSLD